MGLGDCHNHRRFAGILALAGVLLYTALIPGHVISQATALLPKSELEIAFEMSCHNGMAETVDPSAPGEPTIPEKKCPFCKGHAAFMTALAGACDTGILDAERPSPNFVSLNDGVAAQAIRSPHNRGPPFEPQTSRYSA